MDLFWRSPARRDSVIFWGCRIHPLPSGRWRQLPVDHHFFTTIWESIFFWTFSRHQIHANPRIWHRKNDTPPKMNEFVPQKRKNFQRKFHLPTLNFSEYVMYTLVFEGVIRNEWNAKTAGCTYILNLMVPVSLVFYLVGTCLHVFQKMTQIAYSRIQHVVSLIFLEPQFVECSAHVVQSGLHRFFFLPVFHYHCFFCQKDGHDVSLRYCFTWVVFIWYVLFLRHAWFSISH